MRWLPACAIVTALAVSGGCRCGPARERAPGQGAWTSADAAGPGECARIGWRDGPALHLCLEHPEQSLAFAPLTAHRGRVRLVFADGVPWRAPDAPPSPITLTAASGAPVTLAHDAYGPLTADGSAVESYAIVDVTPAGVEPIAHTACPPSGDDELIAVAFDAAGDFVGLCGEPRVGAPLRQIVLRDGRFVPLDRPAVALRLPPDPDRPAPGGDEYVHDLRLFATARAQYVAFATSIPGIKLPERTSWLQPLVPGAVALRADLLDRPADLGPDELDRARTPVAVLALDGDLVAVVEVADVDAARSYRFVRLPPGGGARGSRPAPTHRVLAGCESDLGVAPRLDAFEPPSTSTRTSQQGRDLVLRLPVPLDIADSEQVGATIEYRIPGALALPGFDATGDLDPLCTTVDVPGEDSHRVHHLVASCDPDGCVAVYERSHGEHHGHDLRVRRWQRVAPAVRE